MNTKIKSGLFLIPVFILLSFQPGYDLSFSDDELDLSATDHSIENRIEIFISKNLQGKIQLIDGTKIDLGKPRTIINGDTLEVKDMHTRGKSTLKLRRKSFSISLEHPCTLKHNGNPEKFKKFYAISLSMDKNYMRNRMAFEMLKELGLFDLFFTYGETRINGQSEGIYLLLERPQDWALKKKDSPFIIRRGYSQTIEKIKTKKNTDNEGKKGYLAEFREIYKSLRKYEGEMLYGKLSESIDLDLYLKWLAFNYFVRNGDYTDEVYFYIDPSDDKYKIIPWDYDDIFASQPHEGNIGGRSANENKLLFSSEDLLDQQIALDPYLYEKYLNQLNEVLVTLTPTKIKHIIEETYAELYPYFNQEEIIGMSTFDAFQNANLENLRSELRSTYLSLTTVRTSLLDYLNTVIKE
jgi:spore coat protein H